MPRGQYERKKGVRPWLVKANLGCKHSKEQKEMVRERMLGNKYAEGTVVTQEIRELRRKQMIGNTYALGKNVAEKHHNWKGNQATSGSIHDWIRSRIGKATEHKCKHCGVKKGKNYMEWASISRKAKRDVSDYMPLCVRCHRIYDKNPISMRKVMKKLTYTSA